LKRLGCVAVILSSLAACGSAAAASPPDQAERGVTAQVAKKKWCGRVRAGQARYRVRVLRGRISCRRARRVIGYVLTHGSGSQSSPGRAPKGWRCGWTYGYFNGDRDAQGRAGPRCSGARAVVEGFYPGFRPL